MNNIEKDFDTTIVKGGDGNKGFNTLRVFEAFATQDMVHNQLHLETWE